ncbi:MAG: 3-oxoacyl-[Lachnospiraceae bacterium]|nr:3-oxoacyl-[acyl-carrier-protein] reductase [Lachnospiraceae bacterium]
MENRKTALITGGSRGIGRAICLELAKEGMDIVFSYQKGAGEAEETALLCREYGVRVLPLQADVAKPEDCSILVQKALEFSENQIDVLVNNAGITRDNLLLRMSDDQFQQVIDTNLTGTFYMMREVSKTMLKKRKGRIINISSVVGIKGNPGQVNYAASKAGVIGMTKSLARELAARKITVNAIAPGMIETDMTKALPQNAREEIINSIPMKIMGQPQDIAKAVAFLAGEGGQYITGQVLSVDGGLAI